jgi:hypothetical protein
MNFVDRLVGKRMKKQVADLHPLAGLLSLAMVGRKVSSPT